MKRNMKYIIWWLILVVLQSVCVYSVRQFDDVYLSNLTSSTGVVIKGNHPDDLAGLAMTSIGDINGDGIDDFVIAASMESGYLRSDNGIIYVIYGQHNMPSGFHLANITSFGLGFRILGATSVSRSGYTIANGGDIDKDNFDDLIIGAITADPSPLRNRENCGAVYVVYGGISGYADLDLATFVSDTSRGFVIMGAFANDYLGTSVSTAGDINSDGYADILLGAAYSSPKGRIHAGSAYVVLGGPRGSLGFTDLLPIYHRETTNSTAGFAFLGAQAYAYTGGSVTISDMDGDGTMDVIIGAYNASTLSRRNAGMVYVLYGGERGIAAWGHTNIDFKMSYPLSTLFTISGGSQYDYAGFALTGGKDLNGDNLTDLVIGAPTVQTGTYTTGGAVYVLYGKSSPFTAHVDLAVKLQPEVTGISIIGVNNEDFVGGSVAMAGDVNGDGMEDLLVSEYFDTLGGNRAVKLAYVVLGKRFGFVSDINFNSFTHQHGFKIEGALSSGLLVSKAGDVNHDGLGDFLIGAPYSNHAAGMIYLVYGAVDPFPTSQPTSQPSIQPSSKPSTQPTSHPTGQPTASPTWQLIQVPTYFTMYYAKSDPLSKDKAGPALMTTLQMLLPQDIFVSYEGIMDGYMMSNTMIKTQTVNGQAYEMVIGGPGYAFVVKTVITIPQESFSVHYHTNHNITGLVYTYVEKILTESVRTHSFDVLLRNISMANQAAELVNITTVKVEYRSFTRLTSESSTKEPALSSTNLIILLVCLIVGLCFLSVMSYVFYTRYGYLGRNLCTPEKDYDEVTEEKKKKTGTSTTGKTVFQQQADLRHSSNIGAFYGSGSNQSGSRDSRFMYDQPGEDDVFDGQHNLNTANGVDEEVDQLALDLNSWDMDEV